MKINPIYIDCIKNRYEIVVNTMEGDADDNHEAIIQFETNKEGIELLRECIIALVIIKKHYPHGMGGGHNFYAKCPYWMKWFMYDEFREENPNVTYVKEWYWEGNSGTPDSFDGYELFYYDEVGKKYQCTVDLDDDMKKEIAAAKILED
jgi:hypothetical protein